MINPLTMEECIYVAGLTGHDMKTIFNHIALELNAIKLIYYEDKDKLIISADSALASNNRVFSLTQSVDDLSDFGAKRHLTLISNCDLEAILSPIQKILDVEEVCYKNSFDMEAFEADRYVLASLYMNIVKNAKGASSGRLGNLKLEFRGSMYVGQISDLFFKSEENLDCGTFVKLSVMDNGKGFDPKVPYKDYFNVQLPRPRSGKYGLTFCALACKYLGMHMKIDSIPGNTEISFYKRIGN